MTSCCLFTQDREFGFSDSSFRIEEECGWLRTATINRHLLILLYHPTLTRPSGSVNRFPLAGEKVESFSYRTIVPYTEPMTSDGCIAHPATPATAKMGPIKTSMGQLGIDGYSEISVTVFLACPWLSDSRFACEPDWGAPNHAPAQPTTALAHWHLKGNWHPLCPRGPWPWLSGCQCLHHHPLPGAQPTVNPSLSVPERHFLPKPGNLPGRWSPFLSTASAPRPP